MHVTMLLILLGSALVSWSIGRIVLPFGMTFLRHHTVIEKNYLGEDIPTGYGIVLLFAFAPAYTLIAPFFLFRLSQLGDGSLFWAVGVASLWMVLLGWLDDTLGDHRAKGFKGHLALLRQDGVFTTGLLKAIGGGGAAFAVASVTGDNGFEWIVHGFLIALTTNWINLLDLRPGRALKFYLLGAFSLFLIAWLQPYTVLFVPLMLIALATLKADLAGRLMLGDSGANLLGMQLGIFAASALPLYVSVGIVLLLFVGHVYAERHSLTELIVRISWLNKLDNWGRVKP